MGKTILLNKTAELAAHSKINDGFSLIMIS